MKTRDGFGGTWLTDWRRAAEVPKRTLTFMFIATAIGAGVGDYYVTSLRSVAVSTFLGIACGAIVAVIVRRKINTYR